MASSRGRWASPERTVVWTEPPPKSTARRAPAQEKMTTKVAVVYYLSRNGHLNHPHFMEVALSSPHDGLCLRDVLDRLNVLRGAGMADAYSWSSKRSYKNGYVWQDLTADDPVHPANGNEYVQKGSELLVLPQLLVRPRDASTSSSSSSSSCQGADNKTLPHAAARRKNWSSFDLGEYRAARTELESDEISPPPSSSSSDTLETLIGHDTRVAAANTVAAHQPTEAYTERREDMGVISGGRMRASAVLMQLISCGSMPAPAKRDSGGPSRQAVEPRGDQEGGGRRPCRRWR